MYARNAVPDSIIGSFPIKLPSAKKKAYRPEASIEIAMYASVMKNTMISMGEMLFAPMIPSCTSCRPIAKMASKKRSAINGAVMKFNGKLSRTKVLTLPLVSSVKRCWERSCLGGITRKALSHVVRGEGAVRTAATCVLARKQEWLRAACLAAALLFPAVAALHGIVLAAVHVDGAVDMDIYGAFQLCSISILAIPVTATQSQTYFNVPGRNIVFLWTSLILAGLLSLTVEFYRTNTSNCTHDDFGNPISPNANNFPYAENPSCGLICSIPKGPFSPMRGGSTNNIYIRQQWNPRRDTNGNITPEPRGSRSRAHSDARSLDSGLSGEIPNTGVDHIWGGLFEIYSGHPANRQAGILYVHARSIGSSGTALFVYRHSVTAWLSRHGFEYTRDASQHLNAQTSRVNYPHIKYENGSGAVRLIAFRQTWPLKLPVRPLLSPSLFQDVDR
ncbi:hypothetical protein M8818_007534 [Zalaria obscura]|uniref:Uncharacterized protein n=1 Tax=Zalaria obscura TaxID=2024903 RepID=A0ACC3S4J2_9PEZI